jgi:diaminohydroxyphosphoribosylaminopyrimidine deaminase/5-amino-6-(5-phosphoribosylamino)uracil reductase
VDHASDKQYLDLAARAAARAVGLVEPNPLVGAVIARDNQILGIGHHRRFGHPHAEREALANCRANNHDAAGATLFVTLEPCRHHGKQPPCTDAIIEARIAQVVYARPDPGPASGGGAELLRAAGIPTRLSAASPRATALSDPFIKRTTTGLPWVIAKWAQTIDGRIATRTGESKWISNDRSRHRVHSLRGRVDAIITGMGTVRADDPLLTPRGVHARRSPTRVILDRDLNLDPDSQLVKTARDHRTLLASSKELIVADIVARRRDALEAAGVELLGVPESLTGLHLPMLLDTLWNRCNLATVLIESGPGLLGALFEQDLIDEAVVYIAPLLLGDEMAKSVATGRVAASLTQGRRFTLQTKKQLNNDIELTYRRTRDQSLTS